MQKLIPQEVIERNKRDPKALINFLKSKNTVCVADRPFEKIDLPISTPNGPILKPQERGYGHDCTCWGTGWMHGQVLCGRHIPKLPLSYYE